MVVIYRGRAFNTMDIGKSFKERDRLLALGKENVCIIDATLYGGKNGEYFVTDVQREEYINDNNQYNQDDMP